MISVDMKYLSLLVLVMQNSSLILLLRYSRMASSEPYLTSTAVFLTELVKVAASLALLHHETDYNAVKTKQSVLEVFERFPETLRVAVPAFLYTIQNNLLFIALTKLDAATFQVTYQVKLMTTALFSFFMLNKKFTSTQWFSLCVLTAAVALVQLPADAGLGTLVSKQKLDLDQLVGLCAVGLACLTSGFSGVYFEKILKTTSASLWFRNIQLGLFSIIFSFMGVILYDWKPVLKQGFFQGYTWIVIVVILLQAIGGLLVAIVIKYAGNILKGFASAISIVISSVVSYLLLGFQPSPLFLFGAALVIIATLLYNRYAPEPEPAPEKHKSASSTNA